jgi:hypothetical protein
MYGFHSIRSGDVRRALRGRLASAALAVSLVLICATAATAQGPGVGPIVFLQPGSTRALAMGNAFVLGSTDSDAIFYNPALAEQLRGFGGAVQLLPQENLPDGRLFTLSAAAEWWGGAVALGLQALSYDAIGVEIDPGWVNASGIVGAVAFTRRISRLRLGITGKFLEQRFGDNRDATGTVDVSTAANLGLVSVGVAVQNLGPELNLDRTGFPAAANDLPERVALAVSTRPRPAGPFDVVASGSIASDFDGDITGGLGAEIAYWPITGRTFFARVGGLRDIQEETRLTVGGGFWGDRVTIDYAFVAGDGGSHRVGVRWR